MIKIRRFPKKFRKIWALIGLGLTAALWAAPAFADYPQDDFAAYGVRYVGVTASSATANSIAASGQDGWRVVACIANDNVSSTTINSRVSDTSVSTTTLATAGSRLPFTAYLGRQWSTSKAIYFSVAAGATAVPLDCEIWTPR